MAGRIGIDDVAPVVSGGRYPAKAVVGEIVPVRATVWREGHDALGAGVVLAGLTWAWLFNPVIGPLPLQQQPGGAPDDDQHQHRGGNQHAEQPAARGWWWVLWLEAPVVGRHAHRRIVPYSPATRA